MRGMSQEARDRLVNSGSLFFQNPSQRSDLASVDLTHSELVALLIFLVFDKGWPLEITAVRSDHHDDSGLAPGPEHIGTHACGWAADLWPLNSRSAGDYTDASEARFQRFLNDVAAAPFLHQIGLAGTADTESNRAAAGSTVFSDSGADHVHVGSEP